MFHTRDTPHTPPKTKKLCPYGPFVRVTVPHRCNTAATCRATDQLRPGTSSKPHPPVTWRGKGGPTRCTTTPRRNSRPHYNVANSIPTFRSRTSTYCYTQSRETNTRVVFTHTRQATHLCGHVGRLRATRLSQLRLTYEHGNGSANTNGSSNNGDGNVQELPPTGTGTGTNGHANRNGKVRGTQAPTQTGATTLTGKYRNLKEREREHVRERAGTGRESNGTNNGNSNGNRKGTWNGNANGNSRTIVYPRA
jgi:hypothetical protein